MRRKVPHGFDFERPCVPELFRRSMERPDVPHADEGVRENSFGRTTRCAVAHGPASVGCPRVRCVATRTPHILEHARPAARSVQVEPASSSETVPGQRAWRRLGATLTRDALRTPLAPSGRAPTVRICTAAGLSPEVAQLSRPGRVASHPTWEPHGISPAATVSRAGRDSSGRIGMKTDRSFQYPSREESEGHKW